MYTYKAQLVKIVDGDTVDLIIDLGLKIKVDERCRLYGINAPERYTEAGKKAIAYLEMILPKNTELFISTIKDKKCKYGRYLVIILVNGVEINQKMVDSGNAEINFYD